MLIAYYPQRIQKSQKEVQDIITPKKKTEFINEIFCKTVNYY